MDEHRIFDVKVSEELKGLRQEVRDLSNRVTLLMGGLAVLAFAIPLLAPIIREALGGGI